MDTSDNDSKKSSHSKSKSITSKRSSTTRKRRRIDKSTDGKEEQLVKKIKLVNPSQSEEIKNNQDGEVLNKLEEILPEKKNNDNISGDLTEISKQDNTQLNDKEIEQILPEKKKIDNNITCDLLEVLKQDNIQLNDRHIDQIIQTSILAKSERILYISSINIQAALQKNFNGVYSEIKENKKRREQVYKDLGIMKGFNMDSKIAIIVVIHGPMTENENFKKNNVYNDSESENDKDETQLLNKNDHWSLFCWISNEIRGFHYDSLNGYNSNRCGEVVCLFKKYKLIPKMINEFTIPNFMPIQEEFWECGYYVLLFFFILINNSKRALFKHVSKKQVTVHYKKSLETIRENTGTFRNCLLNQFQNQNIYDSS